MIDSGFWHGKRVFLTGHTGFKGSWLSIWLMKLGAEVSGYALDPPTNPSLYDIAGLEKRMRSTIGDIRDRESIKKALAVAHPEIVIHMAAQPLVRLSYAEPLLTYETNVMGTANLLEAIRGCESVRSIVIITTDKCYDNKEWPWGYRENESLGGYDPYSSSKACAEIVTAAYRSSFFNPKDYGSKHHVAVATARAGNVIGGGDWAEDRLVPDIVRSIAEGKKVLIRSPYAIRPWQHVLEPLSGYLLLAQRLYENGCDYAEAWNFGPYDSDARPVQWIVESLCAAWSGAKGYEIDKNPQPHEATYLKLDCSKAWARLGWHPTWSLQEALGKIVEWNLAHLRGDDMYKMTVAQIAEYEKSGEKDSLFC
jgi:CDP-glucose 4,6-dehydratase